ncbi:hypothetical protein Aperf_G00000106054 [Anoplocephala perfoliata]
MGISGGIISFAQANAVCFQVTSICCLTIGLGLIIGGSFLTGDSANDSDCPGAIHQTWHHIYDRNQAEEDKTKFVIAVAMIILGCMMVLSATSMFCCSYGMFALSHNIFRKTNSITERFQNNQLPMGSYTNVVLAPHYQPSMPPMPPTTLPTGNSHQPTYSQEPLPPCPHEILIPSRAALPPYEQGENFASAPSEEKQ